MNIISLNGDEEITFHAVKKMDSFHLGRLYGILTSNGIKPNIIQTKNVSLTMKQEHLLQMLLGEIK